MFYIFEVTVNIFFFHFEPNFTFNPYNKYSVFHEDYLPAIGFIL